MKEINGLTGGKMRITKEKYLEMSDYFCKMITDIHNKQFDIYYMNKDKYDEEYIKKAKKDHDDYYWSFERAFDRSRQVRNLIEFADELDFEYLALMNLSNAKHHIEGLTEGKNGLAYDEFDTHRFDNLLVDYWKEVNQRPQRHDIWQKYSHINYRRSNVNFGLLDNIQHHRNLVQDSIDFTEENLKHELLLIDKIEQLIKELHDYVPNYEKIIFGKED